MPPRNLLFIALTIIISLACFSVASKNRYANLFAEAMEVVNTEGLREIPREDLFNSAMNGMMEDLDEHSMFISGDYFTSFDEDMRQEFGGVGMYVEVHPETNQLIVLAPMPNTPAFEAGLKVGDQIVEVDGQETAGLSRRDSLKLLRGPVGKAVELLVDRDGELLQKSVRREIIPVASVHGDSRKQDGSWDFRLLDQPEIGYIRLLQFGEKSADEVRAAIKSLGDEPAGVILDLRDNSGGLLDVAVEICDMLIEPGLPIVRTLGRNKKLLDEHVSTADLVMSRSVPVCVLIDRNSASASEILAGCLQDHNRAIVIGEQSWGKGTVQNVIPIQQGKSALKLTTASYWRPSGKNIDRNDDVSKETKVWGVQPNPKFEVELDELEVLQNLRQINIRELRTLVTDKELDYIREIRRLQFERAMSNIPTEDQTPAPDDPQEGEHRDIPLEKAIDYINRQQQAQAKNIAA